MIAKSQQNTMGSYEFDLEFDKTGKLKRLVPLLSPYYIPSKDNYLTTKPLVLTKDDEDKFMTSEYGRRTVKAMNEIISKANKND